MNKLTRILAVLDGTAADAMIVSKAVALAHQHGAALELFLCDAERAYSLSHAYDPTGLEESRRRCVREARRYLECIRDTAAGADVAISVDAVCESPLYMAIVRKAIKSGCDLVVKNAAVHAWRRFDWDANDWELMRACPVTLLLSRGRSWQACPMLGAAVDVAEDSELVQAILQVSQVLTDGCHGKLDVLYSAPVADKSQEDLAALQKLTRTAGLHGHQIHLLSGYAEDTLPAFAAGRGYDAFILGALTHQKGGATALVGSLTFRLVSTLECDFVLIKPSDYQSQIELAPDSELEITPPWRSGVAPRSIPAVASIDRSTWR